MREDAQRAAAQKAGQEYMRKMQLQAQMAPSISSPAAAQESAVASQRSNHPMAEYLSQQRMPSQGEQPVNRYYQQQLGGGPPSSHNSMKDYSKDPNVNGWQGKNADGKLEQMGNVAL